MAYPGASTYPGSTLYPGTASGYTTTGAAPLTVAASAVTRVILRSTGVVPLTVAANSAAHAVLRNLGTVPISVPVPGTGLAVGGANHGTLPLTLTLTSRASLVLRTSGTVPITVPVPGRVRTTGTLPATVTTTGTGLILPRTTGTVPIAVPLIHTATLTVGTGVLGIAVPVTALQRTFLPAWDADRTGAPMLIMEAPEVGTLYVTPASGYDPNPDPGPDPAPQPTATVPPPPIGRYLMRNSVTRTTNPTGGGPVRLTADDFTVTETPFAKVRVIVGGKDVTYFRGVPTVVDSYSQALPFGDQTAQVTFPGITPFDVPGTGDLAWLKEGKSLDIIIQELNGGTRWRRFEGYLISQDTGHTESDFTCTWQAVGALMQAGQARHKVPTIMDPTDIGYVIPRVLNGVVSRRYPAIPNRTTTIMTTAKGTADDTALGYCQNLLATAWTTTPDQWTIRRGRGPRVYWIDLKGNIGPVAQAHSPHWTVYVGAPGVQVDLTRDLTETVNVIYGRGVALTGYAWQGWVYPGLHGDTAPTYPFSSPSSLITIGTTDSATLGGHGVSDWQQRMHDLGYKVTVTGTYSSSDAEEARDVQADKGLLVDGIVGPQTWAATFDVGANAGSLTGAYRRPLAIDPRVDPYIYAADGAIKGRNPAYDPTRLRFERDIDYGSGVSKADATRSARIDMARDKDPAWVGKITLATDPVEYSRWTIEEGHPIRIKGFQQGDIDVRVVKADYNLNDGTVSLDVDTKARDALTFLAIRERNQASKKDPARRPGNTKNQTALNRQVVDFDGESKAGIIPRHALYGGLWTVLRIPVSEIGNIAKIDMTADPATTFCVALFGEPIEPADLAHLVGNPLASDNPFNQSDTQAKKLDDRGFIEGWGQKGQACGYWPKGQSDTGASLTGRFVDTGGVSYISAKPPWVWVAEYASASTFMTGHIYPAPIQ